MTRTRNSIGGAGLALALLLLLNAATTPNFLSLASLLLNLTQVAPTVIVASGMAWVVASRGIDLSVGSVMAIAGALAPLVMGWAADAGELGYGISLAAALLLPLLVAALCGAFNGLLVARAGIQPIVATLILFIAGRGLAQILTDGQLQVIDDPVLRSLGQGRLLGIPVQVLLMAAVVAGFAGLMRATVFGRQLVAVGGNDAAARLSGVPVARVKTLAYVLCAAASGLAGLIAVGVNASSDASQVGLNMELDAIAAVAVGGSALAGGRVSLVGTLIGALIMQLLRRISRRRRVWRQSQVRRDEPRPRFGRGRFGVYGARLGRSERTIARPLALMPLRSSRGLRSNDPGSPPLVKSRSAW